MPSSRGSSQPRDWARVSHTAGRFFTISATREARGMVPYQIRWLLQSECWSLFLRLATQTHFPACLPKCLHKGTWAAAKARHTEMNILVAHDKTHVTLQWSPQLMILPMYTELPNIFQCLCLKHKGRGSTIASRKAWKWKTLQRPWTHTPRCAVQGDCGQPSAQLRHTSHWQPRAHDWVQQEQQAEALSGDGTASMGSFASRTPSRLATLF